MEEKGHQETNSLDIGTVITDFDVGHLELTRTQLLCAHFHAAIALSRTWRWLGHRFCMHNLKAKEDKRWFNPLSISWRHPVQSTSKLRPLYRSSSVTSNAIWMSAPRGTWRSPLPWLPPKLKKLLPPNMLANMSKGSWCAPAPWRPSSPRLS